MSRHSFVLAGVVLAAVALVNAVAAGPAAQPTQPKFSAVDRYLRAEMRRQHIPGMSLAIVKNGRPIYVKGYGVATLEHAVPVTPHTVFQLGSIGKQFTAVAVMLLANEHKLDLDAPLATYLPEVPAAWVRVTLRLMLCHQAGIAQFTTPQRQLLDLSHDYTDAELIALAASQPLDFEPGTDVSYSDTGYVLLGFVINRVAGMFYGDFLQQRIFGPLGMTRTRVISDTDLVRDRASGYELDGDGRIRNQTAVSPALNRTADGSLYSTVEDLMKWDRALNGDAVLVHRQLEKMWQVAPHRNGQRPLYHYGYGWENNQLNDHRLIEYDGNWQGFQAVMTRYAGENLTVILLTNLALCRTERMAHSVAGLVEPELTPYPEAIADSQPRLTADFREFLAGIAAGVEAAPGSDAYSRAADMGVPVQTLQRELRELGAIEHFGLAADYGGESQRRVYRVEGKDMVDFFSVRYGAGARMEGLDLFREY